ncbi:unnamed protein product [Nyctereutes procyonoides]|uniref:(raccoon dog) hypothetical protein n=1 Tax=Nyctereutes procyonoides TaxID=34880 RepID=A0A811YNY1_NYCPR|nr:unnamed protein product [Nyctereutes procyonoides]
MLQGRGRAAGRGGEPPLRSAAFVDPQGTLTLFYWKLVAVHRGFISTFEQVLFSERLPAWLVPQFQNKAGALSGLREPADSREALL